MSAIVAWVITALVALLLGAFGVYVVALLRLPGSQRPRTPSHDRLGRLIGETQNPDYHINPGEEKSEEPDARPVAGQNGS